MMASAGIRSQYQNQDHLVDAKRAAIRASRRLCHGAEIAKGIGKAMSVTSGTKSESGLGETIRVVIHALLIALVIRTFLFQPFNIPSGSMKATLLVGDYLFVSKYSYGYSHYSIPLSPPLFSGRIFGSEPAVLHDGRQPGQFDRQPGAVGGGLCAVREHHRPRPDDLLLDCRGRTRLDDLALAHGGALESVIQNRAMNDQTPDILPSSTG